MDEDANYMDATSLDTLTPSSLFERPDVQVYALHPNFGCKHVMYIAASYDTWIQRLYNLDKYIQNVE